MSHPQLSRLPAAVQATEIAGSKARLEQILGAPVTSFAYPHGSRRDYTGETVRAVRDAGLRSACTTTPGWLGPRVDRYRLPRIYVPNVSGADFERLLDSWLFP